MLREPVVITGVGVFTGFGLGVDALWDGLCARRSTIAPVRAFDASTLVCTHASEVPELNIKQLVPKHYRKAAKVMARDTQIAVACANLAASDADLKTRADRTSDDETQDSVSAGRFGCHIGAGLITAELNEMTTALAASLDDGEEFSLRAWGDGGMTSLPPLWLLKYLPNMLACHVTILHGCEGPSNTITAGEASGLLCLGESARVIDRGDADAGFAGGAESKIHPVGFERLRLAGRLIDTSRAPAAGGGLAPRPYDAGSPGQVLGEGGGLVILERESWAAGRGANAHARVLGFGAAHSTRALDSLTCAGDPPAVDTGIRNAIVRALGDARCEASEIDAIVPHAAGHAWLDSGEAGALRDVFGERLAEVPMITLSPNIGELMAGAAAVQVAVAAEAIKRRQLPGRLHAGAETDGVVGSTAGPVRAGDAEPEDRELGKVLVCTGSQGGSAAAAVLGRIE